MEQTLSTEEFTSFKNQLIEQNKSFTLIETTYTKRVKLNKSNFIFSDDKRDYNELKLINLVKKDCQKFCDENKIKEIHETEIDFYKFYSKNLFDNQYKYVWKIDLSSAYWSYAINNKIISDETLNFFESTKNQFFNGSKKARLKALGSCATKKLKSNYENGKLIGYPSLIYNEVLRNLYLNICDEIDRLMKVIATKFNKHTIYYYWDCLFIENKIDPQEIISFINQFNFKATCNKSVITAQTKYLPQVQDVITGINYPINKKDICL